MLFENLCSRATVAPCYFGEVATLKSFFSPFIFCIRAHCPPFPPKTVPPPPSPSPLPPPSRHSPPLPLTAPLPTSSCACPVLLLWLHVFRHHLSFFSTRPCTPLGAVSKCFLTDFCQDDVPDSQLNGCTTPSRHTQSYVDLRTLSPGRKTTMRWGRG